MKLIVSALLLSLLTFTANAASDMTGSGSFNINYDWLNQIVNKTPAGSGLCPNMEVDIHKNGYHLALQKSFYGTLMPSLSTWFPQQEMWASLSIGPMINNFGILYSDINDISELDHEQDKSLPTTAYELTKWKVKDSAYWESQGGVAFYLGTGESYVGIGVFAVASGGWANYLEKTGPNSVYVERSRKTEKYMTVNIGAVRLVSINAGIAIEKAHGFNYEFNFVTPEVSKAFERFMAGDTTKAYELSLNPNSGVKKIADTSLSSFRRTVGATLATPYIPVISFKATAGNTYTHEEEMSIWDEQVIKDSGLYLKQARSRVFGYHTNSATSFQGGKVDATVKSENKNELKLYGKFKYAYQSDWGQEERLRSHIAYAKAISGLKSEPDTCIGIPNFDETLSYNQVILQMDLSDEYMKELLGMGAKDSALLSAIETKAQSNCDDCDGIADTFANIRKNAERVRSNIGKDQNQFSLGMANIGKAVWSNPAIFKAFYDKGKQCGMEFKFEVSGQRLSQFIRGKKYPYSASCLAGL
ncbi:MAG: hypothetical protein ACXVCY_13585 [Pseudobdellovibrionaceae bacterium]